MFIARHTVDGEARLAAVVMADGPTHDDPTPRQLVDLTTDTGEPIADLAEWLTSVAQNNDGPIGAAAAAAAANASGNTTPAEAAQLLSPVGAPPAILAVGLNYLAHALEGGREPPKVPVIFTKHHNCIVGPGAPVHIPRAAPDRVDYEGELAIVIGRRCRGVSAANAHEVIAGYTIMNDVSVRDWQMASPTMLMGKSWDTHGPCGPWMVTADAINPHDVRLTTTVNGEVRQDARTDDLIFDCYDIVEHLSTAFTLEPATIISTGTPAGVGLFFDPPKLLSPGDEVSISIEGIGTLTNPVVAEPAG